MTTRQSLLYAYPWTPYPRRVIIYLREKAIPSSLVTVVRVSDPQLGDAAPPEYPPRPAGSLPILAMPTNDSPGHATYTYIRQSNAIMNYLDELCDEGLHGFSLSKYSMRGADALSRARNTEILSLADDCNLAWNPVRMFGSGAGTMSIPAASKEMMRWVRRPLATIESWWKDRDFSSLRQGESGQVTMDQYVAVDEFKRSIRLMVKSACVRAQKDNRVILITTPPLDERKMLFFAQEKYPNLSRELRRTAVNTAVYA
ncbi:hypothetical protein LTR54_017539 [Friedmanniomyces endolithicus]|uniref:GST N-terminal domain-containing protein n=1 Tax=Friedmanniomyces endolithicus TaxID=329885 RepID=A0AAN6J076_9PEZI|nr:hypothetical protein LTS00_017336 [Friedmanniomyces endolithicus]KAK0303548.1 hypothetical protein LTR82_017512 [Friedmanniomyces endolithicus]KAK0972573.1 hypothetical protein LTR54_017539 [Friedmanniomyces endolithicus]